MKFNYITYDLFFELYKKIQDFNNLSYIVEKN